MTDEEMISEEKKEIKLYKEQKEYVINEYGNTIEEQRKIIQAMAEFIVNCDIDEDICQYMQDGDCGDGLECKDCIIEYFENEVGKNQ